MWEKFKGKNYCLFQMLIYRRVQREANHFMTVMSKNRREMASVREEMIKKMERTLGIKGKILKIIQARNIVK